MPPREGTVKPQPPATVGHMGGAKTGPEEEERQREGVLGRCPQVDVDGRKFPCLLDTGSQVTLFSEGQQGKGATNGRRRSQFVIASRTGPPSWSSWGVPVSLGEIPAHSEMHLDEVFQQLSQHGLKLQLQKC
ncbi:hypothetical protein SKAU_G00155540 [Synaphobranchus kaupii]|uniref:Uncharacterized protein n=1 Tax=Synaphobranchus kaupii TaxID=118154 RepID=A0A9Q1FHH7_SYNKA|nr:hypothetical protein SKAU_G00155540 [Synaphobranchus kaupii]